MLKSKRKDKKLVVYSLSLVPLLHFKFRIILLSRAFFFQNIKWFSFSDVKASGLTEGSNGDLSNEATKDEIESKKERSVLQAKLTRLAIQIGYAGMVM